MEEDWREGGGYVLYELVGKKIRDTISDFLNFTT